jgi:MFS transporter, DHA1 family, multidrug resistance protein
MADIIREAPLGQIIRWVTRNKFLKYPEEEPDFQCPSCYQDPESADSLSTIQEKNSNDETPGDIVKKEVLVNSEDKEQDSSFSATDAHNKHHHEELQTQKTNITVNPDIDDQDMEKLYTHMTHATIRSSIGARPTLTRTKTREMTRAFTRERFDIEQEERSLRALDVPIVAQKTEDGNILVDWYTTVDPANPQNWSSKKKLFVGLQIL